MRTFTLLVATLLLAACGASPSPAPAPDPASVPSPVALTGEPGAVDVMFLQMAIAADQTMTPVLELAPARAVRTEVRELAAAMHTTQAADVATMRAWLTGWGRPASADPDPGTHAGHGGGLHTLGPTDLSTLRAATGRDFETALLNLLIGYQHNAVELARMATAGGMHPRVRELADRMVTARTAQIQRMLTLVAAP